MTDLRKDLNQLWQSTIDQFDEIKDAIVKSSQAGKAKLDAAFLKRQRERMLAQLGEEVLKAEGDQGFAVPPGSVETIRRIRELDRQIEAEEEEAARLMRQAGAAGTGPASTASGADGAHAGEAPRADAEPGAAAPAAGKEG